MGMVKSEQCDVLVVSHMDRLYRRLAELESIIPVVEQGGAMVVSIDGSYDLSTPMGRLVARNLCSAAQAEVEIKAQRNKDKNVQAAQAGVRNKSGCRPFGWCADRFTPMDPGASLAFVHGTRRTRVPSWTVLDGPRVNRGRRSPSRCPIPSMTGTGWSRGPSPRPMRSAMP